MELVLIDFLDFALLILVFNLPKNDAMAWFLALAPV